MSESTSAPLDPGRILGDAYKAPSSVINTINENFIAHVRANRGHITEGPLAGQSWLILHTTGAKTGKTRTIPLFCFEHLGRWHVIGSFAGAPHDPAWAHNLRAHPDARVEIGAQTYAVTARELFGEEQETIWQALVEQAPYFTEYQSGLARRIPIFELVRLE